MRYADVILPLPMPNLYTYALPAPLCTTVRVGCRIVVPFGTKKTYTAVVVRLHNNAPAGITVKNVLGSLDEAPSVLPEQLNFWRWMADYYLCAPGDVMKAAMPAAMKRASKPHAETYIRLSPEFSDRQTLSEALLSLKRAPKQQALLQKFVELSEKNETNGTLSLSRRALLEYAESTPAICQALTDKGFFETYSIETPLAQPDGDAASGPLPILSPAQQTAFEQINKAFAQHRVCLLHGVTASGKTEVYIRLIQQATEAGKQVLFLVPEIALTTQLTERLSRVFGKRMCVYHSKISDAERAAIWLRQLSEKPYQIVAGVRSSLFLPYQNLGLVVIDEEQEASYKQNEPAPRYHARDSAVMLAHQLGARALLGTATPALETYYHALTGKYGHVRLTERYGEAQLPEIEVVDVKELRRKRLMDGPLSPRLIAAMRDTLEIQGEQVILFQNRRGYAPTIVCRTCGWSPHCVRCDVSLAWHKSLNVMTCHYCGFTCPVPVRCPACGETDLVEYGFGTEKVEDMVHSILPSAAAARLDLDTTRSRKSYESILDGFASGKINVLIGTQMVTKGLDFERVGLVGILDADAMLNYPDFRSYERAFQLMSQVSGRAGRRKRRGLVILQTKSPELELIDYVARGDYASFCEAQLKERKLFRYPPFCRLTYMYLKHKNAQILDRLAAAAAESLRSALGDCVLGPDAPPVARVQTYFIRKIMIKIEQGFSATKVRTLLLSVRGQLLAQPSFRSACIYFDADPM